MVAFNKMLGKSMHANKQLVSDTLKGAMGFDGIVLTDWKGYSRFGGNAVINAGIDMVMAVDGDMDLFQQGLKEGVLQGEVPMSRIDDAVRRILRQKFRLGLFENPFPNPQYIQMLGCQEHRDKARQAVRESLVLLKNESKALPISTQAKKIVVVGEHANNAGYQSGGWSVEWQGVDRSYQGATTILKGIQGLAEGTVVFDPNASGEHVDADYAIVVVGETPYAEFMGDIGEGLSEYTLTLSEKHQRSVEAYAGKGPKTVVLLISGRPLVITEQIELADAFIAAWLPGSEGDGIAEVLFGEYNFTGRLPHSWPASVEDFSGKYGPNYWNDSITPLYDFGYGLVY
jgi:beta-glucosidase